MYIRALWCICIFEYFFFLCTSTGPSLTPILLRTGSLQKWPSGHSGSWCRWCPPSEDETRQQGEKSITCKNKSENQYFFFEFQFCPYRLSPAPLLLTAARHLPLLVEGVLCSRGGRRLGWRLCGGSLWRVGGRGRSWRCGSKRRLLLLAAPGVFLRSTSLLHGVVVVTATARGREMNRS